MGGGVWDGVAESTRDRTSACRDQLARGGDEQGGSRVMSCRAETAVQPRAWRRDPAGGNGDSPAGQALGVPGPRGPHYSQSTRTHLKEQATRYLNVFTGILAGTAFSRSHVPTHAERNRLQGAGSSTGSGPLPLAKSSRFCKVIFLAGQVRVVSRLHYLEALLSLAKKQDP